jgi:hypothetical protein
MDTMAYTMTEAQATDEAVLLFTRKMRRLHPDAFADIWAKLPDGAKTAVVAAENRADRLRDQEGNSLAYPVDEDPEDDEE